MNIANQIKSIFKKKENDTRNYNEVLNEILEDTLKKKKDLHIQYYILVQKVWESEKNNVYKTYLAKYILARLSRESERIFIKASILANQLCPCCNKKRAEQSSSTYHNQSKSLH